MKKKWKSLCDSFRIHKTKQQQRSGSAAKRKNTWVHFERMQFLNDVQLENEYVYIYIYIYIYNLFLRM